MKIYIVVPDILNNGGIKVAAQWTMLLRTSGFDAILANTDGKPCREDWYGFMVPTCSIDQIEDVPGNIVVYNWGPDLLRRTIQHCSKFYYAQDCAQPNYPQNEIFMPILLREDWKLITIGPHSHYYYLYNFRKQSKIVHNFVDTEKFFPRKKIPQSVCMMNHREHYNPELIETLKSAGFQVIIAQGNQKEVSEALGSSEYFISTASGVWDGFESSEGFPLPIAESLASGCVTLCCNTNGVLTFLHDKINGLILENKNDVLQILLKLKDQEEYKDVLRANAVLTFTKKFNKENTLRQILSAIF
jgi:glycosyltransferase involved in cell wall biosynthesis